ncbi:MAG: PHP domain-containing protein [SAR324 cluster bacterium]|nr:PHP domain-containing protein [SAR324 cluster bacterium]
MLTIDFHTHSIASGHGMNTVEELLRQADRIGLSGIAITDHSPGFDNTVWLSQNRTADFCWEENFKGPDVPYFLNLLSRYEPPTDIRAWLFKGIECNILSHGDRPTDVPVFISDRFDVVIASVHPITPIFVVESSLQVTERIIKAMDDPIDIIGHPFHKRYSPLMEPLLDAAVEKGIALEVNNSSLQLGKADQDQIRHMLEMAAVKKCRITLASDAHMANELGGDQAINQILDQMDFPEELIINRSKESALDFVKQRKKVRTVVKERLLKRI